MKQGLRDKDGKKFRMLSPIDLFLSPFLSTYH